jgi:hypothetical protein
LGQPEKPSLPVAFLFPQGRRFGLVKGTIERDFLSKKVMDFQILKITFAVGK